MSAAEDPQPPEGAPTDEGNAGEPPPEPNEEVEAETPTDAAETAEAADDGKEGDDEDDSEDPPLPGDDSPQKPGLEKAPPVPLDPDHLKSILESIIFVADKPISERKLASIARARVLEIRAPLGRLMAEYEGRGIELVQVGGGYQFRSATKNASFVRTYVAPKPVRLSRAQLEALSIVAYRQPVTRPEIDEIRGVDSGSALRILAERSLLKILGRKDEPGRPLLYGTSPDFLEFFGLNSLTDLPTLQEFAELSDESRALFERRMGEPLDLSGLAEQASLAEAAAQSELFDDDDDEDDESSEASGAAEVEGAPVSTEAPDADPRPDELATEEGSEEDDEDEDPEEDLVPDDEEDDDEEDDD